MDRTAAQFGTFWTHVAVTLLIAIFVAPFTLLTLFFALEILLGLKPLPKTSHLSPGDRSAVIIVPAHDEQAVIQTSLERLKLAAANQAQILLVADNCTDDTAAIARSLGIEVIERFDLDRRGKGYALDFARNHLKLDPPEVVLIVDADCTIDGESINRLIASCAALQRPCQSTNLQRPSVDASPAVQLSTFAFFIKNVIRQRALVRLSGRAHLLGTGMAFPWPIFDQAELATSNIVEDLKLGQELANSGNAPVFVEDATVWSNAETDANTIAQRRRWEGGFLQNAKRVGPTMLADALKALDAHLLWAAIDIFIPPFALLIVLNLVVIAFAAGLTLFVSASIWPLLCLCGTLLLAIIMLGCAWVRGGSRFVTVRGLFRAPLYILWKLPMYLGILRRGAPKEWTRTGRA